ncbi:MAG: hypothetical protein ABIP77_04505 [Candidatus Limnocylindrales bacterium]
MSNPATPSADHGTHDPFLIAAMSAHDPDLTGAETAAATTLLATCLDCARLHADLLSLAVALPAASTPARPRDFMLTAADAHRLRPRGLRHWLGLIGTARDTVTRPLAIGFTTLGLAGLLVATVPGALPGSAGATAPSTAGGAASADEGVSAAPGASTAPAAPEAAGAAAPSGASLQMSAPPPVPTDDGTLFSGSDSSDLKSQGADRDLAGDPAPEKRAAELAAGENSSPGVSMIILLGGLMSILGLGLFALRWRARRLG